MNPAAGRADALRQALLECGLAVLVDQLDAPLAALVLLTDRAEARANRSQIRIRQQLLLIEHLGVRDRGADVIANQALIERVVFARRVLQYTVVQGSPFIPQSCHVSPRAASRSAARRA